MSVRTYPVLESQPQPQQLQGKIFQAIPRVMAAVEPIAKGQFNKDQNFYFRGIDEVYAALQMILAKEGVFTTPTILTTERKEFQSRSGARGTHVFTHFRFKFYADDGSFVEVDAIGEGIDYADKASNKAASTAHKYALIMALCIPTSEPKDPDAIDPGAASSQAGHLPPVGQKQPNISHPHIPTPLPRPSGLSGVNVDKPISEAQQKRLFAISSQNGWSTEQMKQLLKLYLGIDSSKLIHWKDYEAVCNATSFAPEVVLGALGVPTEPGPIETTEAGWRGEGE